MAVPAVSSSAGTAPSLAGGTDVSAEPQHPGICPAIARSAAPQPGFCRANSGMLVGVERLRVLAESSVELIAWHQHAGGAYPASPDYPVYGYSWLRDGSFIADAMSRAGRPDSAEAFFGWCARVITARAERISDLVHRTGPIPA